MRRHACRSTVWFALVAGLVASAGLAESAGTRPLVGLDFAVGGSLGATVASVHEALRASGQYDLWWFKVAEPPPGRRNLAALATTGATANTRDLGNLQQFLTNGGGLVLVAGTTPQWRRDNADLLRALGVRLDDVRGQGADVAVLQHEITRGLGNLLLRSTGLALGSDNLSPLITQDGLPLALAGVSGRGRLVVLLDPLVATTDPGRGPDAAKTTLLLQAIRWVVNPVPSVPGAGTVQGPGTPADVPASNTGLSSRAVLDVPADALWRDLGPAVRAALEQAGLQVETLVYQKETATLSQAALQRPGLVVVSSSRVYEDTECAALASYVGGGGSLLALGLGRHDTIKQLSALNRLLGEFGIAMTFGRPAGDATLLDHPITRGLTTVRKTPAGNAIWAFAEWPLATVGGQAVATAHQVQSGRIVVLDAATLVRPADTKAEDTSRGYRDLLLNAIRWLAGR